MARPIKLTPNIHERIVALMAAGNFRETAAAAVGIQSKTLREWLRRGARGEHPFDEFLAAVSIAEAEAEVHTVDVIGNAAQVDWRAAAWRLERKSPSRWAYQVKIAVHEHVRGFIDWMERELPPETFKAVLNATNSYLAAGGSTDDFMTPAVAANGAVDGVAPMLMGRVTVNVAP